MEEVTKFDVSVILPIKSSKARDFDEYFKKAIESLRIQKTEINELIIVHTNETSLVE
jgi:glycosyltransferase involved in cell wall biosynthesis